MQTNATHSFLHVSSFNGYGDNCLGIGPAASFAWFFAANEKFIHFDSPGLLFTILANGAAP
jgi:hypothetical protein